MITKMKRKMLINVAVTFIVTTLTFLTQISFSYAATYQTVDGQQLTCCKKTGYASESTSAVWMTSCHTGMKKDTGCTCDSASKGVTSCK
jgi:hypothetical protein